jgi:hypothetical protein
MYSRYSTYGRFSLLLSRAMRGWMDRGGYCNYLYSTYHISHARLISDAIIHHHPAFFFLSSSFPLRPACCGACRYRAYIDTVHTYRTTCLLARGCWSPELKSKSVVESYLNASPSTHPPIHLLFCCLCMHECIAYRIPLS